MSIGRIAEALLCTLESSIPKYSFFPKDEQWGNGLIQEKQDVRRVKRDAPVPLDTAEATLRELLLQDKVVLRPGEVPDRAKFHDRLKTTLSDDDLVAMRDVAGFVWTEMPTSVEEKEALKEKLGDLIKQGVEARTRAIEGNSKLTFYFAKRQVGDRRPVNEKAGDAAFGLVRGVEMYDPRLGFTFSTYAQNHIEKAIQVGALEVAGVPQHYERTYNEIVKTRAQLNTDLGRTPTDEEVATRLGIQEKTMRERIVRYEELIYAHKEAPEVDRHGDVTQIRQPSGNEEIVYARVSQQIDLNRLLDQADLTDKQRDVIVRHFMQEQTVDEIAKSLGVSKQTASRRITNALEKVKKVAESWDEYK